MWKLIRFSKITCLDLINRKGQGGQMLKTDKEPLLSELLCLFTFFVLPNDLFKNAHKKGHTH